MSEHMNFTENSESPEQTRPVEEIKGEQDDTAPVAPKQAASQDSSASAPPEDATEPNLTSPEQTNAAVEEERTNGVACTTCMHLRE